jgi:hypothetical protein
MHILSKVYDADTSARLVVTNTERPEANPIYRLMTSSSIQFVRREGYFELAERGACFMKGRIQAGSRPLCVLSGLDGAGKTQLCVQLGETGAHL